MEDKEADFDETNYSRAHLWWQFGDDPPTAYPTEHQLLNMLSGKGGICFAVLRPCLAKNDGFGMVFGQKPMYLQYNHDHPYNAARALALLELQLPCNSKRDTTPLFVSDSSFTPYTHSELSTILSHTLLYLHQLPTTHPLHLSDPECYSWHSFRRHFACALKAAGASTDVIMALCRWQAEESVKKVYAELNPADYADWVTRAGAVKVSATYWHQLAQDQLQAPVDHHALVSQLDSADADTL